MAARFTQGDSLKTTRTITSSRNPPEPKTRSYRGAKTGNTMNGMPGYIDASPSSDRIPSAAQGGKGFGPHREASVGKRGGSGAKGLAQSGRSPGMSSQSYKSASTGRAGGLKPNTNFGAHKVHTSSSNRGGTGQKAPPTAKGKIGGGHGQAAGIDLAHAKQGGKMESLRGRTRTSSEGRRKSMMY